MKAPLTRSAIANYPSATINYAYYLFSYFGFAYFILV